MTGRRMDAMMRLAEQMAMAKRLAIVVYQNVQYNSCGKVIEMKRKERKKGREGSLYAIQRMMVKLLAEEETK